MKLNKILVVFLVLFARICLAGIVVQTTQPIESSELIDAAVNILSLCYGEHEGLGIIGNVPRTFLNKLWLMKPIPVIILHETKRITEYDKRDSSPVKPQVLLFIGSGPKEIAHNFLITFNYRWANILAPILVLGLSINRKNGCAWIAYSFQTQILIGYHNVNVLCVGPRKEITLRSVNPYTNQVPHPWRLIGYYRTFRPAFFMFWRPYRTDNEICLNLDYEKTKNLAGKKIRLRAYTKLVDLNESKLMFLKRSLALERILNNTWTILLHQMNATEMVQYDNVKLYTDERIAITSNVDIRPYPLHIGSSIPIPGRQYSNIIIMQSRGNKSQLMKILGIVDIYTQYCLCVTLIITLIFFKYVASQHFIPGILNIFRVICNTGFENLPDDMKSRTFLACLFLCVVTIHGIFSANLVSVLTMAIPNRIPQTVQELVDLKYTIFLDGVFLFIYTDKKYYGQIFKATENCVTMTMISPEVACVENKYFLLDTAAKFNLSVSSKDLFVANMGLRAAGSWPYVKIVTTILLRMSSGHILQPLDGRIMLQRIDEKHAYMISSQKSTRTITLNDLGFTFIILGIGLASAAVSFIIEISINPIHSKIKNMRRYFRR